jgi:hypothetical protein
VEEWREVIDNPNYQVSNTGRVRRNGHNKDKAVRVANDGYLKTDLYMDGKRKTKRINRIVAQAFIPNPENKPEVNHKDGNKLNNNVSNLEWNTKPENVKHAWENGLAKPSHGMLGKKNPNGGRKGIPFRIVETGEVFNTLAECANIIGGSDTRISDCLHSKQKTYKDYHFEYLN